MGRLIDSGDHVIVYSSRTQLDSIFVKPGTELHSRYGHFRHADMVGKPFGAKASNKTIAFASTNGRGFVYLLRPTPELWTLALPHRTQILYMPDIAFVTSHLDIKANSTVIEAGTGSGSFTHAIARSVGSSGTVHSFEYNEERYLKAKQEFSDHDLDGIVRLRHRNVCKDGFELENVVDSVFLDVPAPWEAIGFAKVALKKNRQARICCFSPCIEQVLRTVSALAEHGFSDVTMYETLLREYEPTALVCPDVATAVERIQEVEVKKERRRENQIAESQRRKAELKRKHDELDVATDDGEGRPLLAGPEAKRQTGPELANAGDSSAVLDSSNERAAANLVKPWRQHTFRANALARGHTSYLTFATLLPEFAKDL
ncbi:tRNA (adenine-N(1)-)-methyltransferase catalytic subunit trm61 [Microbotryomycetes sp. JL201]|nr:tRNA (adenine-N(1)-)-methyltransferase catalytic subunit trm61 [Microbotryomycetes sp. JL201]